MLTYSATKNTANAMPEYSTWKPATISDSPSTTSNGARLVSATPEMKYTTNSGSSHQNEVAEEAAALRLDDLAEIQRARGHHHADEREAHRDLVRDHLRRARASRRGTRTSSSRPSRRG